jgi:hypothetical protein
MARRWEVEFVMNRGKKSNKTFTEFDQNFCTKIGGAEFEEVSVRTNLDFYIFGVETWRSGTE